jgi:hypothetical protein
MCAVVAYVYAEVLVKPNMILYPFYKWICRVWLLKIKIENDKEIETESWFYNPIIGCYKCVAGQFGLWVYLVWAIHHSMYRLEHHVFVVCCTIFLAITFHNINKFLMK